MYVDLRTRVCCIRLASCNTTLMVSFETADLTNCAVQHTYAASYIKHNKTHKACFRVCSQAAVYLKRPDSWDKEIKTRVGSIGRITLDVESALQKECMKEIRTAAYLSCVQQLETGEIERIICGRVLDL